MRKRLSSRMLAVILTLAICATTVLGCLMTVSADNSCYTIGKGQFASKDELSQATMDVTFTAPESLPNGFLSGAFSINEVDADAEDHLVLKEIIVKNSTSDKKETLEFVDGDNSYSYYVVFESNKISTLELELVFGFSKVNASENKEYKVQLGDIELSYNQSEYFVQSAAGAIGKISLECEHEVTVKEEDLVKVDEANNYSVYSKSYCTLCGDEFGYQFVPTADKLGGETVASGTTIYWSANGAYDDTLADNGETGDSWENAIIIDSVEELYSLAIRTNWEVSLNKYYKFADGIDKVVLQSESVANKILSLDSAEDVKTYFEANPGFVWGAERIDKKAFAGHFDGNGVTIYGLYAKNKNVSGLFPKTYYTDYAANEEVVSQNKTKLANGNVSVSNVNITNSYICNTSSTVRMGFITGEALLTDSNQWTENQALTGIAGHYADWYLKVSECSLYNNYMYTSNDLANAVICCGILSGSYSGFNKYGSLYSGARFVNVDNCLLYGNIGLTSTGTQIAMVGQYGRGDINGNNEIITNSIVLDTQPFYATGNGGANYSAHSGAASHFKNVYSDALTASNMTAVYANSTVTYTAAQVAPITTSEVLSSDVIAKCNLAWGSTWLKDGSGSYPRIAKPSEKSDTICWDGSTTKTAPSVGTGKKGDPYIISTVAELAYVAGQTSANYAVTDGKYYKIADGIKNIVLQPYAYIYDIMALESAAQTKEYFEKNAANMKKWTNYGWDGNCFSGDIDFNGATVYGIYQISDNNAGLFSNIDAGATFRNLSIKNSYIKSMSSGKNYQIGAIAAISNSTGYGKKADGFVWAQNCTIANNYLYGNNASTGDNSRSGVIFGSLSDVAYVDNCLVYGNDATYGDGAMMPIMAGAQNSLVVNDSIKIPDGLIVETDYDEGNKKYLYYNKVRNSVLLGVTPLDYTQAIGSRFNDPACFTDTYTDFDIVNTKFSNGALLEATEEQIVSVKVADITGTAAEAQMPRLTWGTDWYCGAYGELPSLTVFTTFSVNEVSTGAHQLYASNVAYNEDGSFDFNLHFVPQYAGVKATLYVGTADASKFYKLNATESSYRNDLGENALMFTIPNISAKEIEKVWLPTIVVEGATTEWGRSQTIALADNARAIVEGDYDLADKKVSAALLNYGNAASAISSEKYDAGTVDLLEFGDYLLEMGSADIYYDSILADNGETGDSWENAIIIDSAEEFVYLAKKSGNDTIGKYYKVADGIAAFDLSKGNLDYTKGLAENLAKIQASGKNHSGNTPGFQGNFDGNGVTVYGAWTNDTIKDGKDNTASYTGLFSCTYGTVTIKNVNVRLSYFSAKTAAGGIVGYYKGNGTGSLTIENCSVADCYIKTKGTGYGAGVGALVGYAHNYGNGTNGPITVNNCFVDLDEKYFISQNEIGTQTDTSLDGVHGGLLGFVVSNYPGATAPVGNVTNCVVLGITPYATTTCAANNNVQHSAMAYHFTNVYTDQPSGKVAVGGSSLGQIDYTGRIFQLTKDQMTGSDAKANMALDWDTTWVTTSGYPTFISVNYEAPKAGRTISYTGNKTTIEAVEPTTGSGTKNDPVIINTVQELAWVLGQTSANVAKTQKYFKIADGITSIVLQKPEYAADIMALSSAAETKAYFEANASKMVKWNYYGWEGTSFVGDIDFNGATVYGLYQISGSNAGLFSTVDAGAAIKNVTLKNSYLTSTVDNYQVGGIIANTNSVTYGGLYTNGIIWLSGCVVANNYMYNPSTSHDRSGVLVGASSDTIYIDNCLTYGNDATYATGTVMPIVSSAKNDISPSTNPVKPEGVVLVDDGNTSNPLYNNMVRNSMFFGAYPFDPAQGIGSRFNDPKCYQNVYTDMDITKLGASAAQVSVVSADKAIGPDAKNNMPNLDWNIWYVGATGDYPALEAAGAMPSAIQTLYNSMVLSKEDNYGDSVTSFGMYGTSLGLKANPYISFTFEFGGEYAKSSDVAVTFKSGNWSKTVTAADMTNKEGAGRFHLYKLTNVPVTALSTGVTVSVSYKGGAAVDFGTYSAEGFAILADEANRIEPCDYYATRYDAARALLFYSQMLVERYGA